MQVTLKFDLPFSLEVDGNFTTHIGNEQFAVDLRTVENANPNFPGAESVQNVAILNDDTNIIAYTSVTATYHPENPAAVLADPAHFDVGTPVVAVANMLITAARVAHGEYFKEYIYLPMQLGPIQFDVRPSEGTRPFAGVSDQLMGGITIRTPPRRGSQTAEFARVLSTGHMPTLYEELLFDAKRYKLKGNVRMAVTNLVMSFEIGLSSLLALIAARRGDRQLQSTIEQATIGALGQNHATAALGHSLEKVSFWGEDTVRRYLLMRETRNKVLHRATLSVVVDGRTWDYSQSVGLDELFVEFELLWETLTKAVQNVLEGRQAL